MATPVAAVRPFAATLEYSRALTVTTLVSAALIVRVLGLGASGFSEDEINKLHAIDAYSRFDFSANAEHPMLMKLADWVSVEAARWWDRHPALAALGTISEEGAVRLPNAIAGAATSGVIFLLAEALFDTTVGAWAALFWAVDINAAAINRIGKEDTFLLFFLLLAAYLYERGKAASVSPVDRDRWFTWSGASFGLMLASKYMPHYFGLHTLFNIAADRSATGGSPDKRARFYLTMAAVFLAANFAVLLPGTWHYLNGYIHGETLRHSGYNFAHHLYVNSVEATPWGLPPTFYAAFFATKVPLMVIAAAVAGTVWIARHATHRGATFVRVFLVFTLLPYSLVASKFLRYILPALAVVDIAAGIGIAWLLARLDVLRSRPAREFAAAAVALATVVPSLTQQLAAAPYYGLAQNAVGAYLMPRGSLFPDDEFYDAGVREAVEAIAAAARPGAVVCSDASAVTAEYLARFGRPDMRSCSIAHDGLPLPDSDTWVIVQEGHTYFENAGVIDVLRRRWPPWLEVTVGGEPAVQVFHVF